MVASGGVVVGPRLVLRWATKDISQVKALQDVPASIDGPINILLLGMDERDGEEAEGAIRADSIIIAHIPASHDQVYLISIPRDTEVAIPAYPKTNYQGTDADKINAAFAFGATKNGQPDDSPDGRGRGGELTAETINKLVPGGLTFNAMVILNYDGFLDILNVLGGVDMCVDEDVYSIHYNADGTKATHGDLPDGVGYHYKPGCYHMEPWQALDYSRQRHLPNGDYDRQRHQQQLIKAILNKMTSTGVLTNVGTLLDLQKAAGNLVTMDLGSVGIDEWFFTMSKLRPDDLTMVRTNGGTFYSAGAQDAGNQTLSPDSMTLLQAVAQDKVLDFLTLHQDWVSQDR